MKENGSPYASAVVVVAIATILIVGGLVIYRPEKDNTQAIVLILGFALPVVQMLKAGEAAEVKKALVVEAQAVRAISKETHDIVNSRMDELQEQTKIASSSTGRAEGIEEERVRTENKKEEG